MLSITRDKMVITINVNTGLGWNMPFTLGRSQEIDAILLQKNIQNKINTHIEAIRRNAYNEGFEDHKKRKPKQSWFSGSIERTEL